MGKYKECKGCIHEDDCDEMGNWMNCCAISNHPYEEKICSKCGANFCYDCCANTNVDEGGKYEPSFMDCPKCGQDWYQD